MLVRFGKIIRNNYIQLLDFLYPLFKRWMHKGLFYYLASGGINVATNWIMYFVVHNFVVQKQVVELGFIAFSPHIASLIITFPFTFLLGFGLSKYVSFAESTVRTHTQLFRYAGIISFNFLLSYVSIKLLVEWVGIYPTPSNMITTIITSLVSYFSQKHYSFKK
jgi:hypothetical protein